MNLHLSEGENPSGIDFNTYWAGSGGERPERTRSGKGTERNEEILRRGK